MAHLGSMSDRGSVEWKEQSVPVAYLLVVTEVGGMIDGRGTLEHSRSLAKAMDHDRQLLRLENGETVRIFIESTGSAGTQFITFGIIPGGWEKFVN